MSEDLSLELSKICKIEYVNFEKADNYLKLLDIMSEVNSLITCLIITEKNAKYYESYENYYIEKLVNFLNGNDKRISNESIEKIKQKIKLESWQ